MPIEPLAFANGALSVALDLMMILIPLGEVVQMQMHWKKKAGVIFMFLLGTFVTVVSTLRLLSVSQFSELVNITWKFYGVALWSTVEINVGLICTCLPTMRLILVRISPRVFGSQWSRAGTRLGSTSTGSHFSRKTSAGNPAVLYPNLEDLDFDPSDDPRGSEQEHGSKNVIQEKNDSV
ncbi:hypothetical protein NLG97_g8559 [Lecanicillium saksenae]|uniref:Uncharacterized protein n=1 Tax=Lecanicillium saksenae TaxID=468837 RepID=A0ACC1QIQ0_9HYPO|nr:hypothetical protein NLG97_g8559 [Lecanicillium saksenae]